MRSQVGFAISVAALISITAPATRAQGVATVPVSPHSVTLKAVTADGRSTTLKVLNGGLVELSVDEGPVLGITPVLKGGVVQLTFFEMLTRSTGESYGLRQLDGLTLDRGVAQRHTYKTMVVDLSWEGVEAVTEAQFRRCVAAAEAPVAQTPPGGQPEGPCMTCCVTCGGIRGCGCAVVMDCGSCCCPDACTCQ